MRKFKYVLIALVLVAAAVGISMFLIPHGGKPATLASAPVAPVGLTAPGAAAAPVADPEAAYNAGQRSFPVISGLADKRVTEGHRDQAIALLEAYVKDNAADPLGHKKLAEQYQLAGRQADYNTQLELVAQAEPTEANLRVLNDIYNANKDYPKQVEVLKKIVALNKGEKPQDSVDLATMQVVVGDQDGAFQTVNELKAKHPDFSSYPMTRILVSALAQKGQVDQAFQIAQDWINTPNAPVPAVALGNAPLPPSQTTAAQPPVDPKPDQLADLCNILHYSGHADKAIALVEPHLDMLERSPELVVAYVNANITAGRSDHAYAILQKIDEAGKMTPQLYPPYLELAIKREDIPAAETIANKMDTSGFNEEQALNIIEIARANDAPSVLDILTNRFSEVKILEGKPVLAAVISILKNQKDQDKKIETALNTPLSGVQRIRLAEACARAKKTACFDTIVKQFPPMDKMSPDQIAQYAQLYIIAERPAELVDPVGVKAQVANAHDDVKFAWLRLAAAAGRKDVTKPWLEQNANRAPENHLQELFYLANDRRHYDVSSDIAERLYARDPSPMNRDIMVAGYVGSGQEDKALPLLRDKLKEPGTNDGQYITVLSHLGRKNATYRKELTDYASAALQSGRGDNRAQLNYAYVLINNGERKSVLPYAKQFAGERGGEWKKMYAGLTQKPGSGPAVKLTHEQLLAMAHSKTISAANKRQVAFQLLNDGYKADATAVFADMAQGKGPDSQEVKDLMYLWGGKFTPEQLHWVEQRAATANPYDKGKWAELINAHADDQAVVQYVSATPDSLYSAPLRKRYFGILAKTGSRQNYTVAMQGWVAQTTDVPALLDYASTGQAFGYKEAARNGYGRVLQIDPNNGKALSQMSALDFSKGNYRDAQANLDHYLATSQGDPETDPSQAHFYKAELLKKQGSRAAAQQEYAASIQLNRSQAPDALSRLYTAQFNLGQDAAAMAGFNQLLAAHPDDKGILADYMSCLIEHKYFEEATRVANQYDKNSPYYGRTSALIGKAGDVASVERFSQGREMKITFTTPIEEHMPVKAKDLQKLAWIDHSEFGYDSMTVSAKPGYAIRYLPTAQEQFAMVPVADDMPPQVETDRAQDLRLQLLYAQIESQTGQTDRARQRLAAIQQYYPQNPQLVAAQADVANAQGNVEQARQLMGQAHTLAPDNEDYAQAERATRQADSKQFIKLDHEYRNYGSTDEQITTLSGVAKVASATEIGFNLMNDAIDPKSIRNPKTGFITGDSAMRQAGELFVGHYLDSGSRVQGSLFDNVDTLGIGAYYAFTSPLGRSQLIAEAHKPYWDFPEAVYDYATRDRLGFTNYADINPRWSLGVESSINRYNIRVDDSNAQSFLFRASTTYALQQQSKTQPFFGVGYGFDGEYLFGKPDSRTYAGNPNSFRPFPMRSREVHEVTGIYRDDWTETTHVLFDAGWVYDRINSQDGPVVEGRVDQDLTDRWQVGARGSYTKVASGPDGDATVLGADLLYKF